MIGKKDFFDRGSFLFFVLLLDLWFLYYLICFLIKIHYIFLNNRGFILMIQNSRFLFRELNSVSFLLIVFLFSLVANYQEIKAPFCIAPLVFYYKDLWVTRKYYGYYDLQISLEIIGAPKIVNRNYYYWYCDRQSLYNMLGQS